MPPSMTRIQRAVNMLQAREPKHWKFLTSLTNCTQLRLFSIMINELQGEQPNSISNFSTTLQELIVGANQISGSIPLGIGNLVGLTKAVKVLNVRRRGALKSFKSECEALRNIRHQNLVKIISVCSSVDFSGNDFKALVYEFFPNGSLEKWMHIESTEGIRILNFAERLSIAMDVASVLDYLHSYGDSPIVHCDLKPSNILLDGNMMAHVGDFGVDIVIADSKVGNTFATSTLKSAMLALGLPVTKFDNVVIR
ncbi:hypothetical protein Taro_047274 [Colocasia esculenta]|uniref:Protein kinase domain-containing protein n=1 Tax=Colocasia esculenta TaxID=4460 RepID=A0A843WSE7_COLES|nr:hypothetical protein [Colocasia esculenta]